MLVVCFYHQSRFSASPNGPSELPQGWGVACKRGPRYAGDHFGGTAFENLSLPVSPSTVQVPGTMVGNFVLHRGRYHKETAAGAPTLGLLRASGHGIKSERTWPRQLMGSRESGRRLHRLQSFAAHNSWLFQELSHPILLRPLIFTPCPYRKQTMYRDRIYNERNHLHSQYLLCNCPTTTDSTLHVPKRTVQYKDDWSPPSPRYVVIYEKIVEESWCWYARSYRSLCTLRLMLWLRTSLSQWRARLHL